MENSPLRSFVYLGFFLGAVMLSSLTTGLGVYLATKQAAIDGTIAFLDRKAEDVQNLLDEAGQASPIQYSRYFDEIKVEMTTDGCESIIRGYNSAYDVTKNGMTIGHFQLSGCWAKYGKILRQTKDVAYLSIPPDGIGGYILRPVYGAIYKIDLNKNTIEKEDIGELMDFAFSGDRYLYTNPLQIKEYQLAIKYIQEDAVEYYPIPKAGISNINDVSFSPSLDKVAFVVWGGPEDKPTMCILDLKTKTYILEKEIMNTPYFYGWQTDGSFAWEDRK